MVDGERSIATNKAILAAAVGAVDPAAKPMKALEIRAQALEQMLRSVPVSRSGTQVLDRS
jgi:hypothetical protein